MTLLVFTLTLPELSGRAHQYLPAQLESRLVQLFSYALSFAALAFLWLRHHAFFRSFGA